MLERSELQRLLANAISKLPTIEKTVLSFYYYEEMTLLEISKIVRRHESRIAQLKAQAILRLRSICKNIGQTAGTATPETRAEARAPNVMLSSGSDQACRGLRRAHPDNPPAAW